MVPRTTGNAKAPLAGPPGAAAIDASVRLTVEGPRTRSLGGGGGARRGRSRAGARCFTGERSRFAVAGRRRCCASIRHAGAVHGGASLAMPSDPRTVEQRRTPIVGVAPRCRSGGRAGIGGPGSRRHCFRPHSRMGGGPIPPAAQPHPRVHGGPPLGRNGCACRTASTRCRST